MPGGTLTVTAVTPKSLDALSSTTACRAISVWLPVELPPVFQTKLSVVDAPTESPGTVWVPMRTLSVVSLSVTAKAALRSWVPTFLTATATLTLAPLSTEPGALTLVISTSVPGVGGGGGGGGGGGSPPSTCTPNRFSTRSIRFAIVWVELPANNKPTGFRLASSLTINDPESPPPENDPGSIRS